MPKAKRLVIRTHFTAAEVVRLSGVSSAMVDYLCRIGLVRPGSAASRGRGKPRQFSFADVVVLRALSKLLNAGVSVSRLKRALSSLRQYHRQISEDSLPASHLVTDGRDVYLQNGDEVLEELRTGQHAFAFIIELGRVRAEVIDRMKSSGIGGSNNGNGDRLRSA
jgi:DNA-binding transcriptional MerR regulator